jgi:hypothetical protein
MSVRIASTLVLSISLFACGGGAAGGPEAAPLPAPSTTATAVASGDCASGEQKGEKDLASCNTSCQQLEATAPAGSRCIPPRVACLSWCKTQFK